MSRFNSAIVACAAAVILTGCEASKSSHPLSPTVAGPIPGVSITAPNVVQPTGGLRIAVDQQPIALMVDNSATNGVRPLSYAFEIAIDIDFTNKVFTREGIAPGDGHTILRLPDSLATGHTYYWHARAQDGANTGPFSPPANFTVFTPVVIQAPVLIAPAGNATTGSQRPRFTIGNAPRSGPAGAMGYVIEVSDSDSFANKVAVWVVSEAPNQTSLDAPEDLGPGRQLFWHARGFDPTTLGPFSATEVFRTPAAVVVPPPGGGGVGNAADMMSLNLAAVYNSPSDVASWAVTTHITRLEMSPGAGPMLTFSGQQTWPDYLPAGWSGPLQYTVWAVVNVNGQWNTSGFIQMWRDRVGTGAPILAEFALNWAYDFRWGPMAGYHPHAGEQMGFFVTAGNARGEFGVTSVRERSNVVVVPLPAGDSGVFTF